MRPALREAEDALIRFCDRAFRKHKRLSILARECWENPDQPRLWASACVEESARPGPVQAGHCDMYKNQLQELAQRSCFNLPSYGCLREGPDHAPRFKATVRFNNEVFEGPGFCGTLRQAEHAVAEVALQKLSRRGPSQSLAARVLDETGVCKNLLQETTQKASLPLPVYTSTRGGPGHLPVYVCSVTVGGRKYVGQTAKTKKQAEKYAAATAWAALKTSQNVADHESDEQAQTAVVKALLAAAPEGEDRSIPSTSAADTPPILADRIPPPRERPRTSRLLGGLAGAGWQSTEYGLGGVSGSGGGFGEVVGKLDRVGLPPAPAAFNMFGAAPVGVGEWISPAEAKQAKVPSAAAFGPSPGLAPIVVPRKLQLVHGAALEDEHDSDYESPSSKVREAISKKKEEEKGDSAES